MRIRFGSISTAFTSGAVFSLAFSGMVMAQLSGPLPQDPEILNDHYRLAEAFRQNDSVPDDVVRGMQLHTELVAAGHVPSMRRLAVGYLTGTGVEIDRAKAIDLLRASIAGGDPASTVWLGRALVAAGGYAEEAHTLLLQAMELGLPGAHFHFARTHVRRGFGDLSDPAVGIEILTSLSEAGDAAATYELATSYRQGDPTIADPVRARAVYQALVDVGDARSGEKLAEMYRDGLGGLPDPDHAVNPFAWAHANGRPKAATKQIDLLVSIGRFEEARTVMADRVTAGEPFANIELALADVSSAYGPASRLDEGTKVLVGIAADPAQDEALRLAEHLQRRSLPAEVDVSKIASLLQASAEAGDRQSIEAVISLSRQRPELFEDALLMRSSLLARLGSDLGSSTYFEETVRLIGETTTGSNGGPSAVETLAVADGEGLRAGIMAAYSANRNLYVYLLQDEMRKKGIYSGQLNGVANNATMRAIMELCRQGDVYSTCATGPLGAEAATAIADVLVTQRIGES